MNADWLIPHPEYLRLERSAAARQSAYRQLFRAALSGQGLEGIRGSAHKSWAVGGERFKQQIEALGQRRAASLGRQARKDKGV